MKQTNPTDKPNATDKCKFVELEHRSSFRSVHYIGSTNKSYNNVQYKRVATMKNLLSKHIHYIIGGDAKLTN